jgi:hypothetical protein
MPQEDETKEVLRNLLEGVLREQGKQARPEVTSYLAAQDGQFLGSITENPYDTSSLLNQYGPFGSMYSSTSIFNQYSPYGSPFGQFSVNNPYSTVPPQLYIQGQFLGHVTKNQFVPNAIATEAFIYSLQNDLQGLLAGRIAQSEVATLIARGASFIVGSDGTFLGKLIPNKFDADSIFNKYGPYGNKFSPTCIFNPYSPHGGRFSPESPFNQFAKAAPKVYLKGKFVAFLTKNSSFQPSIDPDSILEWASQHVSRFE